MGPASPEPGNEASVYMHNTNGPASVHTCMHFTRTLRVRVIQCTKVQECLSFSVSASKHDLARVTSLQFQLYIQ